MIRRMRDRQYGWLVELFLVNNAAFQATHQSIEEITDAEWDHTFHTNIYSIFYLVKAALPLPTGIAAYAQFVGRTCDEAMRLAREAIRQRSDFVGTQRVSIAAAGMAGHTEAAATVLQELRRAQLNISLAWIANEIRLLGRVPSPPLSLVPRVLPCRRLLSWRVALPAVGLLVEGSRTLRGLPGPPARSAASMLLRPRVGPRTTSANGDGSCDLRGPLCWARWVPIPPRIAPLACFRSRRSLNGSDPPFARHCRPPQKLAEGGHRDRFVFALTIRPFPNWGWVLASGLVGILLALILWANLPVTAVWLIGLLLGINLISVGAAIAYLAWHVQ